MRKSWTLALALGALVSIVALADEMKPPAAPINPTFQRMKALVGTWSGTAAGKPVSVTYSLVSDGSALMERLHPNGEEEMVSMYAPDGDGVMMTHYCSMHNQPRMRASASPSGAIEFKFVDATNLANPSDPHMDNVKVNIAEGKLSQEWGFKMGDKVNSEVFSYTRSK